MTPFHLYAFNSIVCFLGAGLFLWWWHKIGKATEIYILIMVLFIAVGIEKSILAWMRFSFQYGGADALALQREIVTHRLWWLVGLPSLLAFSSIVGVMLRRIWVSNRAVKKRFFPVQRKVGAKRTVLCISNLQKTRRYMRGVCASNSIDYCQSGSILHGLELLIQDRGISIVLIGMQVIEDTGLTQRAVVDLVKKESPHCIVVAMTRQPNLYELFEARRAFFDDYLYLPIEAPTLIDHFERWFSKVNRWRRLDFYDRRRTSTGEVIDRKNVRIRGNGTKGPDVSCDLNEHSEENGNAE
jgi:hypothetical protein